MLSVEVRTGQTSRGLNGFSPWIRNNDPYTISAINLGSNLNSKIEIVSALNSLNLGHSQYYYHFENCLKKYNPKLYLGTIQTLSELWNRDAQTGQTNGLGELPGGNEKSGSC